MRPPVSFADHSLSHLATTAALATLVASPATAVCPEATALHFNGPGTVACACFIQGEEAGVQLTVPADKLPIEVIRVGVGWGSQFGGSPQSLEAAIHVYEGGLPAPGVPVSSLPGPVLSDGFINEFDLEAFLATAVITSNPFVVSLEFLNDNANNPFVGTVVHDGNGCQLGKNVVFAIPGGWLDACLLGVSGDWVMYAVYREVDCGTGISEEHLVGSAAVALLPPQPSPFRSSTRIGFFVERERSVDLAVYDVTGRRVADLANGTHAAGPHSLEWDGTFQDGSKGPAGVYFVVLDSDGVRKTRKIILGR